jgi:hypothetical protein
VAAGLALLAALSSAAAAQAPQPPEPVTAALLEQRVADELASEGVVLSSHGLHLQVKQVGSKWLVSLVEISTGRPTTSTRVDQLPADRDAAVAVMTDVVANLVAHALDAGPPVPDAPPSPPPATPPPPAPAPAAPQSAPRPSPAELVYQRQALRFAALYDVDDARGTPSVRRRWLVFQGDPGQVLSTEEFYRMLGRDDLVSESSSRHAWMVAGCTTAGLGLLTAAVLGVASLDQRCNSPGCSGSQQDVLVPLLVSLGVSVTGIAIALHFEGNPQPLDEANAKALADAYNQRLREKLGLPPRVTHRARIRDVTLTPYVAAGDGGVVLRARF